MKHRLFTLLLIFWSLPIHAQQNTSTQTWVVPFQLYNNFLIVVRGSIGDLNELNLLIDTATNPTVVDRRITERLHLSGYKSTLPVVSGNVSSSELLVPDIAIGPVTRRAVRVASRDISGLEASLGVRIDALVGLDVLGGGSFLIDYENRTLTFGSKAPESSVSAPFRSEPPFVTVDMKMNQQPLNLLVDTASPGLVLFEKNLNESLRQLSGTRRSSSNLANGISLREINLTDTQLGGLAIGPRQAFVASDPNDHVGFDGLLGVSALQARQIAFDFERHRFTWQTSASPPRSPKGGPDRNCVQAGNACLGVLCDCASPPLRMSDYGHFRSSN